MLELFPEICVSLWGKLYICVNCHNKPNEKCLLQKHNQAITLELTLWWARSQMVNLYQNKIWQYLREDPEFELAALFAPNQ